MPGKIFINYRRGDVKENAARIRDRLAGVFGSANVFMDVDNLLAGQRFDKELEKALVQCDVFLAVIGPRWMELMRSRSGEDERDYVREEITAALNRGILVIPVLVERAQLPRRAELPEEIRKMVLHQKHDVAYEHFGRDMQALITAIKAGRRAARGGSGARLLRAVTGLTALLLICGAAAYWGGWGNTPEARKIPTGAADAKATENARAAEVEREWQLYGKDTKDLRLLEAFIEKHKADLVYARLAEARIEVLTAIKAESVNSRLDRDVVQVVISDFSEQTHANLVKHVDHMKNLGKPIRGYIVDLRDSPGGLLNQAIAVADDFLEKGAIVLTKGDTVRPYARPGDIAEGKPIIVIINGRTGTEAEVVAAALQDHKRATLIGTRSAGKGPANPQYYSPAGRSIQGRGLDPDIIVEFNQLDYARKLLRGEPLPPL